ncbi:MAG TPA: NifU family protein [Actinomycetota bacterium]|nr:NifU family protein [Actinomycetota bacterium]
MSDEVPLGGPPGEPEQVEELGADEALERMGTLIEQLENLPDDQVRSQVFELLDWMEAYHRESIHRLIDLLPPEALEAAKGDPLLLPMLEAYEVIGGDHEEADALALVEEALQQVRPYIHSHGGEMELLSVEEGVVRLSLMGSCDGCPSSAITLTQGVEEAIRQRWSGLRRLEVETPEGGRQQPKLLQIQTLRREA